MMYTRGSAAFDAAFPRYFQRKELKALKGGFSFCGVDIVDLNLNYAPDLQDTYVYRPTEFDLREESTEGQDGGYFYGASKKPKEFVLRCYFENKAIDRGLMTKIYHTFKVGNSGKLIFKRKPWCYYYATVVNAPAPELYNYLNGLFTVTMKAYYPFARCDSMVSRRVVSENITDVDRSYFDVMQNTALFESEDMVPQTEFTNVTSSIPILLANPGTERAPVCIVVAGDVGGGIVLTNLTTGQRCGINAITRSLTTEKGLLVLIDSLNGNVMMSDGVSPAFVYHDRGFISLEPSYPCIRDVYATFDGTTVTTTNILNNSIVGKYIYNNSQWAKITHYIDEHTFKIQHSIGSGTHKTMITLLNEIIITKKDSSTNYDLSTLKFVYKPTFS